MWSGGYVNQSIFINKGPVLAFRFFWPFICCFSHYQKDKLVYLLSNKCAIKHKLDLFSRCKIYEEAIVIFLTLVVSKCCQQFSYSI